MAEPTVGFGPHLMMDGYRFDQAMPQDLDLAYRIPDEPPSRIGMTKIMPPHAFKYSAVKPPNGAVRLVRAERRRNARRAPHAAARQV